MRKKPIVWLLMLSLGVSLFNFTPIPKVSAASAIDFQDHFTDGNYTADPEWTVTSGTWTVAADPADASNKVLSQTDTGEGIITTGDNWTDSTVSMRFYTGAGGAYPGILARVQDYKNFYYFQMQAATGLTLTKRVNNTDATIKGATAYTLSKNTWYTLKLVLIGSSIKAYIVENGKDKLLFDAVDTTFASGKIGIRNKWQSVQVDDVMVTDIPAANSTVIQSDTKTSSSVSLKWDAVNGASSYNVYRSTTSGSGYSYVGSTTSTSYSDTGLSSDTDYYYKIAYLYGGLTESQWSPEFKVKTIGVAPAAPTSQTAAAVNSSKINLSWAAVAKASGYKVYQSSNGGTSYENIYDGTSLSFQATGLTANKAYKYQITAYNAYGESPPASVQATTYAFDAPANFKAASTTDSSVTLTWDALPGSAVTYSVKRAASAAGTFTEVYNGADTTFTNTGLTQGTGYFYTISAVADGVSSALSDLLGVSALRTSLTPGALWADTTGNPIDAHGAGMMYDEKTKKYYWYGEYHKGGWPAAGVRVYSSTDLMNWKDEGMALTLINSMDDFTNDPLISKLYEGRTDTVNIWADIRKGRIVERPKVIYNDETKKYVMWAHIDGDKDPYNNNANYGKAQAGVAISDSPTGPFVYQRSYRMDQAPAGEIDYQPGNPGMARDMNLFKDDDGTAYLIYSSEENLTIYISKLMPDYLDVTGWHKDGNVDENGNAVRDTSYKGVNGVDYVRVFPGAQREAPAMFKYNGHYYLITSGATGWSANQNKYTVADHIFGPWAPMQDPFVRTSASDPDPTKAFNTQSTYVIPVDPENGKFIYVGDIWNGGNFANDGAKYVFLPIEFGMGTDIAIKWYASWTPDLLNAMGQVNVTTKFPEAVKLGEVPSLPSQVDVLGKTGTVSTPVTWSINSHALTAADFAKPGPITVQMTLPEYYNKVQSVKMYVVPDNALYFVNAGGYATSDYKLLASYMQDTLANKTVIEQAYNPADATPWGYLGKDSMPSGSADGDIFSTVRYLNGGNVTNSPKGTDLAYQFTLENGSYDVYLGFNDPWTNTSRKANLLLNDENKGAITFTPSNTMAFTGVNATNGTLNITVRNTAAQDPMISWILIVDPDLTPAADSTMGLTATAASSTSVKLAWNKTTGALGYNLYRSDSEDGTFTKVYSGTAGTYTDSSLPSEHTYFYKVGVIDGTGMESALSAAQNVTIARTAKEIADGITAITAPAKDATTLALPGVPAGYSVSILSSDNDVIGTDGVITPPAAETTVNLVLRVTRSSDNTTADTASIAVVVPAKSEEGPVESTAQEVADGITSITAPAKDATALTLPEVPAGFTIAIQSSDNEVIGTDGIITPPPAETTVNLVLRVTRTSDNTTADTVSISVVVPAKSEEGPVESTAQEVANGITSITAPAKDARTLTLPGVPAGFTIAIQSSDNEVIGTNGDITPPAAEITVHLVLRVTRTSDNTTADTASIAVVVPAKSSQGNSGSGGNSSSSNGLTPVVTSDLARLTVNGVIDLSTKVAKGSVTSTELTKALLLAPVMRDGRKVVEIELTQVAGAEAYEQQIPASLIGQLEESQEIRVKTPFGTATLPAGMFTTAELGSAQNVTLHIGTASSVDQGKPAVDIHLLADNKPLGFHNDDVQVRVTIPYTPAAGENPEHLVILYVKEDGMTEPVPSGYYDQAAGVMVFTTTHFSKYAVALMHKTFNDLTAVPWAKAQIEALASRGIIKGTSAQTYSPNAAITRADFIQLLVSALGLTAEADSNFADVQTTDYYYRAVGIAKKLGITNGIGENRFDPRASISRQDMMTLTAKALVAAKKLSAMNGTAADISGYADADQVSSYAADSIATLVKNGIVQGSGSKLSPLATTTRAEVAVMLYNLYKN
ncbi:S-layer homology domain-containing protein [Paenibacillus sp. MMO-177]|uniref:S-layer homology domain-containing protein n=1 Tax=Paenibacillus sp. MMO-177 TaxID=3081289 RepID=UPI00301B5A1F